MKEHRPPREDEAEKYVIGCMIQFADCAGDVFRRVRAADFVNPAHRAIVDVFSRQHVAGGIDPVLAGRELQSHRDFRDGSAHGYLLELGQRVATSVHVPDEVTKILEARRKRQRIETFETLIEHSLNGCSSSDIDNEVGYAVYEWQRERNAENQRYRIYSAADLDSSRFETNYLIENILVAGEPCALGAPEKHLKTTLMLAAGVSLNLVDLFLGHFQVNQGCRFLMFSGESSLATIQETARRICRRAGRELSSLDGFSISPDLPQLDDAADVTEFEAVVSDHAPNVVAIDPMMLCLGDVDEKAANMFAMGKLLRRLNDACQNSGATLLFAHHTSGVPQYGATPKLSWLAFSGFKQFIRQWWLCNRLQEYEPGSGFHQLKFVAGGSAGHNGLWVVEVNEGRHTDPGGRHWDVKVKTLDEARQGEQQSKAAAQQKQVDVDRAAVCRLMAKYPAGASKTFIKEHCGVSGRRWPGVFAYMFQAGELIECEITIGNKKTPITGYRLNTSES